MLFVNTQTSQLLRHKRGGRMLATAWLWRNFLNKSIVQGAAQVRNTPPEAVRIFILPPSFDVLAAHVWTDADGQSGSYPKGGRRSRRHEIEQSVLFDFAVDTMTLARAGGGFAPHTERPPSRKVVAATADLLQIGVGKFLKTAKIPSFLFPNIFERKQIIWHV